MNILALDLGTKMGWALGMRDGSVKSGTESFSPRVHDGQGHRWMKFRAFITQIGRSAGELHAVYYEDVRRHGQSQVISAHIYGGFLAHLQYWCALNNVPCIPVGVGQIKKHWTGSGIAKKEQMMASAEKKGFKVEDDNHADALAILSLARHMESSEYVAVVKKKKSVKKKIKIEEKL